MLIVYCLSSIILTATVIKFLTEKKATLPSGPIIYTFLAFLIVQIVSTFFSIDPFTSVFGYPTRLNGGLLSQFAYFVILVCALINLDKLQSFKLLALSVLTALAVSLWGIPSHFGYDPTCLALTNKLTSDCWQAEFQPTLRIFSTLGQPNWLASYLVLIFPLSLALLISRRESIPKIVYGAAAGAILLALILTNSRSGIAGLGLSLLVLFILLGKKFLKRNLKFVVTISVIGLVILAIFGSSVASRFIETKTGVAAGGTETGRIRLIVWQGAWNIFKSSPIIGTGPETFAFSYQKQRPEAHNKTTEWNFFYNKAHNEFLNYLANTGVAGILLYLSLLYFVARSLYKISKEDDKQTSLIAKAVFAGIAGYQLTIFFGFSVVASQTLMFLLIAIALTQDKVDFKTYRMNLGKFGQSAAFIVIILLGFYFFTSAVRLYFADVFINRAKSFSSPSHATTAFNNALLTHPANNPYYLADFASNAAIFAANFQQDALFKDYAKTSNDAAQKANSVSPNNFLNLRKLIGAYTIIGSYDTAYEKTGEALALKLEQLAPNDPQTYYTVAKFYLANGDREKAIDNINQALKLKSDYMEAKELKTQLESSTIDNSSKSNEN